MRTRILEFLKAENKYSAQLAEEIGVQPSGISHILSGRNNPSLDYVLKMLGKYPSLSTEWLLFGKGKMYNEASLNDLFDAEPEVIDTGKEMSKDINEGDTGRNQQNRPSGDTSGEQLPPKQGQGPDKPKRIVFFYGDGTFNEYIPG